MLLVDSGGKGGGEQCECITIPLLPLFHSYISHKLIMTEADATRPTQDESNEDGLIIMAHNMWGKQDDWRADHRRSAGGQEALTSSITVRAGNKDG